MKNKWILAAILLLVMSGIVFAQGLPNPNSVGAGFTSPQSSATQGRLRSAADDFIRPDAYAGMRFENAFGMVSFASTNRAALGYATRLGGEEEGKKPVYISAFYTGTFWSNVNTFAYEETNASWLGKDKNDVRFYTRVLPFEKRSGRSKATAKKNENVLRC